MREENEFYIGKRAAIRLPNKITSDALLYIKTFVQYIEEKLKQMKMKMLFSLFSNTNKKIYYHSHLFKRIIDNVKELNENIEPFLELMDQGRKIIVWYDNELLLQDNSYLSIDNLLLNSYSRKEKIIIAIIFLSLHIRDSLIKLSSLMIGALSSKMKQKIY